MVYRIGIDVGGTFTDFTLLGEKDGEVSYQLQMAILDIDLEGL